MAILQLVDQLAAMLEQARDVPLSRYRMVDTDEFNQLIERMRISVPSSIRESERTLAERDHILAAAHAEAERIVQRAKQQAAEMVHEESIVHLARQEADRIVADSHRQAQERAAEADQYAAQVLQDLAARLQAISQQVDNGLQMMQQQMNGEDRPAPASDGAAATTPAADKPVFDSSVDTDGNDAAS